VCSPCAVDSVMAEYITIMVINNKTSEEITTELLDRASRPSFYCDTRADPYPLQFLGLTTVSACE
jgi:hypothetical protein